LPQHRAGFLLTLRRNYHDALAKLAPANDFAIPRWQAIGASVATIVTELVTIGIVYLYVKKRMQAPHMFEFNLFMRLLLWLGLSLSAAFFIRQWPLWYSIPFILGLTAALALGLRILSKEDKDWLHSLWKHMLAF
jgi:hypothetical protein